MRPVVTLVELTVTMKWGQLRYTNLPKLANNSFLHSVAQGQAYIDMVTERLSLLFVKA